MKEKERKEEEEMTLKQRMMRRLNSTWEEQGSEGSEGEQEEQEQGRNHRRQKTKKGDGRRIIPRKIKEGNAAKARIKMGKGHKTATARGSGTT